MDTTIIPGQQNGSHVVDGPLTTTAIREASPELLINEIDSRIVRIRPMATPVDQISRMVGARPASSMVVEYYSVDTRPVKSESVGQPGIIDGQPETDDPKAFMLHTKNDRLFAPTETILMPTVLVGEDNKPQEPLVVYVEEVIGGAAGGLRVIPLNMPKEEAAMGITPEIPAGAPLVRMGRAAAELDVQTAQFEALPVKDRNFCQIFKVQVEQGVMAKLSAKEVGWNFTDQEEVAIMDMRMGMEKSFLFGTMMRLKDSTKYDEILFTRGIWNQAETETRIDLGTLTQGKLLELLKTAFTGTAAGSSRKILIAGADIILAINNLESTKVIMAGDTVTRWGIDFNEIRSKFGSLYVVHSEIFDQCGHSKDGLIIDPQYMTKYSHVPFHVEHLDLKKSGIRNTDAIVATEASCLVLRHPKTHIRVIGS